MNLMNMKGLFIILILIIIMIYVSVDSSRKKKMKLLRRLSDTWGKPSRREITQQELEIISHLFRDSLEDGKEYIDDITWKDLNMDEVFRVMNTANSSAGQEYLYRMLRMPERDRTEQQELHRLAEFFTTQEKKRIAIQKHFAGLGFAKYISLSDYVALLVEKKSTGNVVHFAILAGLATSVAACFVNPGIGVAALIVLIVFSILSYYKMKAQVESYFICITQVVRMIHTAQKIAKEHYDELQEYNAKLDTLCEMFSNITRSAWLLESGNVNGSLIEALMDYLRMITHVDLIQFNRMVDKLSEREQEAYELMNILGKIEATICIASFREMLPFWSEPEFVSDNQQGLVVQDVYHPLIAEPVTNSITTKKNILLTGSNASGKSTFLRTIAINALLSQAIDTSVSRKYIAPRYRIYSSMSLVDDLSNSNSYYMVEIQSLKRILEAAGEVGRPVLCFVDEVLRGTNTVERIAASSEILKYLQYQNVLCFAATHDVELTTMLVQYYENYHFQEEVTKDNVTFNYRLYHGPATTRNAIKLLKMIGYDEKIVTAAEKQAGYFVENGVWKL